MTHTTVLRFPEISGTLDELEPILRQLGFTHARTLAGAIDLATFDPYGARRPGSVNLRGSWADPARSWRGMFALAGGKAYLADAKEPELGSPFVGGLFELLEAQS